MSSTNSVHSRVSSTLAKEAGAAPPEAAPAADEMAWNFYDAEDDQSASKGVVEGLRKEVEETKALLKGLVERQNELEAAASSASTGGVASSSINSKDLHETRLPEDTFSFLVTSKVCSVSFLTAVLVFLLKSAIFSLILVNNWDREEDENQLGIPAAVPVEVSITQFLALFICVLTQDDLLTSIVLLFDGYADGVGLAFKEATYRKWICSVAILFAEGCLGLAVTFILIIQSSEVISLLLNFTVIEFVSLLDNVVFFLSSLGFFGQTNKEQTNLVSETSYTPQKRTSHRLPLIIVTTIFLVQVILWSFIFGKQKRGDFLPQTLIVQFTYDELATYSGTYSIATESWTVSPFKTKRVKYLNDQSDGSVFDYCNELQAWTFSYSGMGACQDIAARSSRTTGFDITDSTMEPWLVNTAAISTEERFLPMPGFQLMVVCNDDHDCGGSSRGTCTKDTCECKEGFFGVRCQFSEQSTCQTLLVDEMSNGLFPSTQVFSSQYQLRTSAEGEVVLHFGRPLYFNDTSEAMVLYAGLRWVLVNYRATIPDLKGEDTEADLASFFSDQSAAYASSLVESAEVVSEPVEFNSINDMSNPGDLDWFIVGAARPVGSYPVGPIEATFRCTICNEETNPCGYGNQCLADGICSCTNGASGSLCQVAPFGNGRCDPYFNTLAFAFDGGDCCAATCVNTDQFSCGSISVGSLRSANIGYAMCKDTDLTCPKDELGCWVERSNRIRRLSDSIQTQILLSQNGLVLVEGSPDFDAVRVFDQVDSTWRQRGDTIEGDRATLFGKTLAISTLPGSVVGRRIGMISMLLAVGIHDPEGPMVRIFFWKSTGDAWRRLGGDVELCIESELTDCDLKSLEIATNTDEVTLVAVQTDGVVLAFRSQLNDSNLVEDGEQELSVNVTSVMTGNDKKPGSTEPSFTNEEARFEATVDEEEAGARTASGNWTQVGSEQAEMVSLSSDGRVLAMASSKEYSVKVVGQDTPFVKEPFDELFASYGETFPKLGACSFGDLTIETLKIVDSTSDFPYTRFVKVMFSCGTGLVFATLVEYSISPIDGLYYNEPKLSLCGPNGVNDCLTQTELFFDETYLGGSLQITYSGAVLKQLQTSNSSSLQMYRPPDTPYGKPEQVVAKPFDLSNSNVSYSISSDGLVLAVAEENGIQVFEANPICAAGEVNVRFSLVLDEFPAAVSWLLETVQSIGGLLFARQTLRACDSCYDDNDRFSRTIIAENVCVMENETACVRVEVTTSSTTGSGLAFIALFPDGTHITSEDSPAQVAALEASQLQDCEVEEMLSCGDGDMSVFALVLNFDFYPEETSWNLTSSRVGGPEPLASGGNYSSDIYNPRSTHIFQECVPRNERLVFTMFDSNGLSSRDGYSLYLDWIEKASRSGAFIGYDEVIFNS